MSAYPYPHPQPSQEDIKASYDDLIDQYSSPYAPNARHQTFSVGTPLGRQTSSSHSRLPSTTKAYSLKQSEDTHETSYNYPPPVSKKEKDGENQGFWQRLIPESLACRLYVATVLLETTIDLAIEGELFLRVREKMKESDDTDTSRMSVYLSVFALAHVFQFVMAVDAVWARNTLQFLFLTVFNAVFILYSVVQIKEIQEFMKNWNGSGVSTIPINILTIIMPIVISFAELAYIALGWKIYHEFGWKVYKFLGADRQVKKMYAVYQVYECLVKFDVFFWAGFSVQFIWLVLQDTQVEYYITCAAIPFSLVLLVEGHLAARYENKWMMATFMLGCVGALVYFVYKLVQVLLHKDDSLYKDLWKSLSTFSVIAIILLVATFVYSVLVLRNFGRGLKDALARKALGGQNHQRIASRNLNRMSIE